MKKLFLIIIYTLTIMASVIEAQIFRDIIKVGTTAV